MSSLLPRIESHFDRLIAADAEKRTGDSAQMWLSAVDTRTGRATPGEHIPKRVYRLIGAPRGSTLYWDQPLVVAAHAVTDLTGNSRYSEAADRYIGAFLAQCVDENDMFQWGNHQYYDVFENRGVAFHGGHHELRPITPAWELFWRHDPDRTAAYIRTMARRHVYDPTSGGFNRHDDGRKGHAFLEAGGILAESLSWLYGKTGDEELQNLALRIAQYSHRHRGASTGLVVNEPDMGRWDSRASTSEVGVWAQSLLRAAEHGSTDAFVQMAADATRAYVKHAYDDASGMYFGQLAVDDGTPVVPSESGYWPREYADVWNTDQWPTHDYPMAVAEACLSLYTRTREQAFLDASHRWARIALASSPAQTERWTYAENYGRCIHFLVRAGRQLGDAGLLSGASAVAEEAVDCLYENGMFQGYPGEHVYESVDGVGVLVLALMSLETGEEVDLKGFGF